MKAITQYEKDSKLSVYYQLYNPWTIPFTQRVPIATYQAPTGEPAVGTRIVPASAVHNIIGGLKKGKSPSLKALAEVIGGPGSYGWPLEHFVAELLLKCREGSVFESIDENRIQNLFFRRTGPIAAAIAITIEGP